MKCCKGTVLALRQCGGCVEVIVEGESPGAFPIDNCCFRMIAANEGIDWIGRPVEYREARMRFLDHPVGETEHDDLSAANLQPLPHGSPGQI